MTRAVLVRQTMQDGRQVAVVRIGQRYVDAEDVESVEIDMGECSRQAWWEIPLPSCPDCGGEVVWAEAGYVPGTRECTGCGSMFSVSCR